MLRSVAVQISGSFGSPAERAPLRMTVLEWRPRVLSAECGALKSLLTLSSEPDGSELMLLSTPARCAC